MTMCNPCRPHRDRAPRTQTAGDEEEVLLRLWFVVLLRLAAGCALPALVLGTRRASEPHRPKCPVY